jgi:hypothetical protein
MVGLQLVWGILLMRDDSTMHHVSMLVVLMGFMVDLFTFKLQFHCFNGIC